MSEQIDPAVGSGTFFTHPEVLKILKETIPPPSGKEQHMSRIEAISILMRLSTGRDRTVEEVTALQMGAVRLMNRNFQRQRNWARRREAAKASVSDAAPAPGAEAPSADTPSPYEPEGEGK